MSKIYAGPYVVPVDTNLATPTAISSEFFDEFTAARDAAGRAAWAALHSKRDPTPEWFETEWKPLIPQGCGCSGSANALLEQNPPRFDSPAEFFRWSVEFHNLVNRKLDKPEMGMEEALDEWRP